MVSDPQIKNISESGFNVSLTDGRMFENFLEDQSIGSTSGNVIYEGNYRPTESQREVLAGKSFDVFLKGKKLASTTIKNVGDYSLEFSNSTGNVEGIKDIFPSISNKQIRKLSKNPDLASSLQGVADAFNVDKLSFKPVQKATETVNKETVKETAEKVAESENVDLFTKLVKPIGAVLTVITAIITIKKLR